MRVGRVDSVELDGELAKVRFRVEREQPLYGNTKASVVYQNIIGQRYIGLSLADFGAPERLPDGAVIPVERTEPSFDVTNLLNGFEPMFTLLDPTNRGNLSNALINALQGDQESVVVLISETSRLAQTMAGPDQVLGEVIESSARSPRTWRTAAPSWSPPWSNCARWSPASTRAATNWCTPPVRSTR